MNCLPRYAYYIGKNPFVCHNVLHFKTSTFVQRPKIVYQMHLPTDPPLSRLPTLDKAYVRREKNKLVENIWNPEINAPMERGVAHQLYPAPIKAYAWAPITSIVWTNGTPQHDTQAGAKATPGTAEIPVWSQRWEQRFTHRASPGTYNYSLFAVHDRNRTETA